MLNVQWTFRRDLVGRIGLTCFVLELGDNEANSKIVFQAEWVNMCAKDTVHVTLLLPEGSFVDPLKPDTRWKNHSPAEEEQGVLCGMDNWEYKARREHTVVCLCSGAFLSCGVWAAFERVLERSWWPSLCLMSAPGCVSTKIYKGEVQKAKQNILIGEDGKKQLCNSIQKCPRQWETHCVSKEVVWGERGETS